MKLHHRPARGAMAMAVFMVGMQGTQASLMVPIIDMFTHGAVDISIGSPGANYKLLFDPGSSNTWVGAEKEYTVTASSRKTPDTVAVSYGSGNFSGTEYMDILTLGGVAFNQSIGVASNSAGVTGVDGLLGLGPANLTKGTLNPGKDKIIPTVVDNLFSEGHVESSTLTIANQTLIFGSTPLTEVTYAPLTELPGASNFWGIDASLAYGDDSLLSAKAGIIDHGSTLILLENSSYNKFLNQTGAVVDKQTSLPMLSDCSGLNPIILTLAGVDIPVPVENYRWPADKNVDIGGEKPKCYLAISDLGTGVDKLHQGPNTRFRRSSLSASPDENISFILGYNSLRHFGVVLDKENSRVGIAS